MNNEQICRIKNFCKNPIAVFGIIVVILSIILLIKCNFSLPEYYMDRTAADAIAQTVSPNEVSNAVKHLRNPHYQIDNAIFHLWGCFIAMLIFTVIFQVKQFQTFKKLSVFNKKLFAYLWINISYPIWCYFYISSYMADLGKHVYNGAADSFGIPFFTIICTFTLYGIIYYPISNLLTFVTYNTKIKRIFYIILWAMVMLLLLALAFDDFGHKFTYNNLVSDFYYIVWIFYGTYSIGYIKNKNLA